MSDTTSGLNLDKIIVGANNIIILACLLVGQVFGIAPLLLTWVAIVSCAVMLIGLFTKVVPLSLLLSGFGVKAGSIFKSTGKEDW
jgi:hypothetical protein